MNLENIFLSEINQVTEGQIPYNSNYKRVKFIETERKMVVTRDQRKGRRNGVKFNGYRIAVWNDSKALEVDKCT